MDCKNVAVRCVPSKGQGWMGPKIFFLAASSSFEVRQRSRDDDDGEEEEEEDEDEELAKLLH